MQQRDSKPVGPEGRILVYQVLADAREVNVLSSLVVLVPAKQWKR